MKIYLIDELMPGIAEKNLQKVGKHFYVAKPLNVRYGLRSRMKAAFLILTGKATPVYFASDIQEEILELDKISQEKS